MVFKRTDYNMPVAMPKKILIMGLPGAGKTTLSLALAPLSGAFFPLLGYIVGE